MYCAMRKCFYRDTHENTFLECYKFIVTFSPLARNMQIFSLESRFKVLLTAMKTLVLLHQCQKCNKHCHD